MVEAEKSRLEAGHTFPDKDLLKLRVAKEANRRGIHFTFHAAKCANAKRTVKCLQSKPTTMTQRMVFMLAFAVCVMAMTSWV
jgi:hypothetical protein